MICLLRVMHAQVYASSNQPNTENILMRYGHFISQIEMACSLNMMNINTATSSLNVWFYPWS